jgi:hypothetical protein
LADKLFNKVWITNYNEKDKLFYSIGRKRT